MTYSEYRKASLVHLTYPNVGNNYIYPLLGLLGEFGEFKEKIPQRFSISHSEDIDELIKEAGDFWWFFIAFSEELKIGDKVEKMVSPFIMRNINWDLIGEVSIDDEIDEIEGEFFTLCEKLKKIQRDSGGIFSEGILNEFVFYMLQIARHFITISWRLTRCWPGEIMEINVNKLKDRIERNVISGNGDNR